jgi:hypothetical protein
MALLDQLLSGLTGVSGAPFRGVLMNVLGHGGGYLTIVLFGGGYQRPAGPMRTSQMEP